MVSFYSACLQSYWHRYQLLDCVVVLVILIITTAVYMAGQPFCRSFSWNDPTINYPFITDVTFPIWFLVLCIVATLFLFLWMIYFLGDPLWPWIKVQCVSLAAQQSLVNLLKLYAGRIRPDYLNRLRHFGYSEKSYEEGVATGVSASEFYCQLGAKHAGLREGRLSFPSGHSSVSFVVFTAISLFLFARLRPFSRGGSFVRLLLSLSPLTIAFLCAVSRTRDYWHNLDDIIAGALIGSISAVLCFHNSFRITEGGLCVARWEVLEAEARGQAEMDFCLVTPRVL